MIKPELIAEFKRQLPENQLKLNEPLAPYTTLKIGGPAELFFVARSGEELAKAVKLARKLKIDWVVLGGGSNVLISDHGFKGLVIINQTKEIEIVGESPETKAQGSKASEVDRHEHAVVKGKDYAIKFDDLDYDESHLPGMLVKVDSGVNLSYLISWALAHGLTGLQWFNRIPGTVGGAVFNNIHGGAHYLEELIQEVQVLTEAGKLKNLSKADLGLGYDKTRFHGTKDIILGVILRLYKGDVERAKKIAMEWATRKAVQPRNSAGCTFKNISQADREKLGYPTTSIGYIIEWVLKWTNKKIGDARIYDKHHAFIVNDGHATAEDVLTLIKQIKAETKKKTGVDIEPEIFFVGFDEEELKGVTH